MRRKRPRGKRLRIGLFVRQQQDAEACVRQLVLAGEVRRIKRARELDERLDVDLCVIEVEPFDASTVVAMERCRKANPLVPLLAVGRKVDPDLAVEVVKLLANDFLSLPLRAERELLNKAERLLGGRKGPAVDRACLVPLRLAALNRGTDRRHVYRALVPAHWRARAHVLGTPATNWVEIEDLAIPHQGWPGAMLLRASRDAAEAIVDVVPKWGKGARLLMQVLLEGQLRPIDVESRVVRIPRPTSDRWFHFVVEYDTDCAADSDVVRTFWMDCQTRSKTDDERTPKPVGRAGTRRVA